MIILLIICLVVFAISWVYSPNLFSPSIIVSGIWLLYAILFLTLNHNLYAVSNTFIIGMSLWVTLFCFTSLIFQNIEIIRTYDYKPNYLITNALLVFSLLLLPSYINKILIVINSNYTDNIIHNLRMANTGALEKYNIPKTTTILSLIWSTLLSLELIYYKKSRILILVILILLNIFYIVVSVSKLNFLFFFLTLIIIFYYKQKIKNLHIIVFVVSIFFIFLTFQKFRSVKSDNSVKNSTDFISLYFLSGGPAFSISENQNSQYFGENTFRFYYALLHKIGLNQQNPKSFLNEFVEVPMKPNVYTNIYPYYIDFGYIGIAILSILLGTFYGFIYRKTLYNKNYLMLYTYFITILTMQYMSELFFTTFSTTLQISIIFIIIFNFSKK